MQPSTGARRAAGDEQARFYRLHHPSLMSFVGRRIDEMPAVEDVCQQAWLGFFIRWSEHQRRDCPPAVLFAIARNKISDWYRQRERAPAYPGLDDLTDRLERMALRSFDATVDVATRTGIRMDIARAVTDLTPRQRLAFELRYVDDLSAEAAGYLMGIAASEVRRLTSRAVTRLRQSSALSVYRDREGGA